MTAVPVAAARPGDLCTGAEIEALVHAFYAAVRRDPELGPIFAARIDDWDAHLDKLVGFWSCILLKRGCYVGAPMPAHARLPGLEARLFERWLALFAATAGAQPNQAMAREALVAAERIANSLWMGWQAARDEAGTGVPVPLARRATMAPRHDA